MSLSLQGEEIEVGDTPGELVRNIKVVGPEEVGYDGRVSIEALYDDLETELRRSLAFLKEAVELAEGR